jgi:hypothetical protein
MVLSIVGPESEGGSRRRDPARSSGPLPRSLWSANAGRIYAAPPPTMHPQIVAVAAQRAVSPSERRRRPGRAAARRAARSARRRRTVAPTPTPGREHLVPLGRRPPARRRPTTVPDDVNLTPLLRRRRRPTSRSFGRRHRPRQSEPVARRVRPARLALPRYRAAPGERSSSTARGSVLTPGPMTSSSRRHRRRSRRPCATTPRCFDAVTPPRAQ